MGCSIRSNQEIGDFHQLFDKSKACREWMGGDADALEDGEQQCRELTKHWLDWLQAQTCEMPAAIRFDYFIGRAQRGRASVWTLEICELGFSMLAHQTLPSKVFAAMLRSCMHEGNDDEPAEPDVKRQRCPH